MLGKKVCSFFQRGNCRNGNQCPFQHVKESDNKATENQFDMNVNGGPSSSKFSGTNSKICGFFLKGTCTKQVCRYFHGYAENLQNANIEKIHDKSIVSLNLISESKFLSADENTIKIWMITESEHKMIGSQSFDGEKITRVVFSNEKVIAATVVEQMYEDYTRMNEMLSSTAKLYVITDKGVISQLSELKRIHDIIEIDSLIIVVGEGNQIEIFMIDFSLGTLKKIKSIGIDINTADIMCIAFSSTRKLFFTGHRTGILSAYTPDSQNFLNLAGFSKFHDGAINRIMIKDTVINNTNQQFVMTCSSDGFLKVFKSDESFENIGSKCFDTGVNDIFQSQDYEKTEYFVLSLDNGEIAVLNFGLEVVFKIPSIANSPKRFVINLLNPCKGDVEGNFLIASDGNAINVNIWIKQGAIDTINEALPSQQGGQRGDNRGKGGYRGFRGGRGGYQGGRNEQGYQGGKTEGGYQGGTYRGGHQGSRY